MRDVLVQIPRDGGAVVEWKLNAAHSWGRIPGHKAMVEKNFRLEIDRYVTMDFGVFSYAIDQIGGVDIEMTAEEARHFGVGSAAGTYHLDGETALDYSRERHVATLDGNNDDWGRTERQRRVVEAAFNKATQKPPGPECQNHQHPRAGQHCHHTAQRCSWWNWLFRDSWSTRIMRSKAT